MKKILLKLSFLFVCLLSVNLVYGLTCTQTFSASGNDDDPTVLTINIADITCHAGAPINSLTLTNSAGNLTNSNCGNWYNFTVNVDGTDVVTGCAADIDGTDITAFSVITITSTDLDAWSDGVTIELDVEVDFTASCTPPAADAPVVANEDCTAGTFDLTINVTDLGDGTPVFNYGTGTQAAVIGANTIAGLTIGTTYTVDLEHGSDAACNIALGSHSSTLLCNDDICGAYTIACGGSASGSTASATLDAPPTGGDCGSGGATANNVWYKIDGTGDDITASLCSSGYDTRIDVYCETSGTCSGGTFECIGGNDDDCSTRSSFTFASAMGNTYYLMIHGWSTSSGAYTLDITCAAAGGPPPANDDCAGGTGCRFFGTAEALTVNTTCTTTTGDNTTAATGANPSCDPFGVIKDVWYSFVAPASTAVNVDVAVGTATEMEFVVWDACGGAEVPSGCGDVNTGGENLDVTGLTAGATYYIQVWSSTAEAGTFDICVTEILPNDDCNMEPVNLNGGGVAGIPTGIPIAATTVGATDSGVAANGTAPCSATNDPDDDVWFEFTTDTDGGDVTIDIVAAGITSPVCEVFSSCVSTTALVCGTTSTLLSGTTPNTQYFVRVYDAGTGFVGGGADERAAGGFTIEVSGTALPAEIISFTGKAMDKYNALAWETASEQNTSEFAIERSLDGRTNWKVIGTERAAGNSDVNITYSFDDMRPATQGYYRLRTIDLDGSSQVSNIVSIKRDAAGFDIVLVAPNPTASQAVVTFESAKDANVNAVVTDITGKVISTLTQDAIRGLNNMTIDLSNAPSGVYFLTMNNGVNNITRRIVKN